MRSPHTEPGREVWGRCHELTSHRAHLRTGKPPPRRERPSRRRGGGICALWPAQGPGPRGANRATPNRLGRTPHTGRGLQCQAVIWPRSFVRENRGPTGDLLPLSYLGASTSASPCDARARGKVSRQPTASAGACEPVFRCVSRDTRATSRKGVLRLFKAGQKNRLFGGKTRHFPTLAPQTLKYRAGGSISPTYTTKTA